MNRFDLRGRSAIVTGGAQGLGWAIAQRFAESGARVALWDRDTDLLNAVALPDCLRVGVDVTDPAAVEAALAQTLREFGKIDILVNSAGIGGPIETVWDYAVDAWRTVIDVNLMGVFLCCHAVIPAMRQTGYGRIINIASIAGKEGNPKSSAYSAAKAGVIALSKSLGKELATDGVIVNAVAPAAFDTGMVRATAQEHRKYMAERIPMGRLGRAEEMGSLVSWMASEECSFSTGAVFDISGGRATY